MAVQQNKKSRSARDMRRSHDGLKDTNALSVEKTTGEVHLRHHVTPNGAYRGRQVIVDDQDLDE